MNDSYDLLKSDPVLAKALSNLQNPSAATAPDGNRSLGWADGIGEGQSAKDLLDRADVQADLRAFFKERDGDDISNSEELKDRFFSDRTWRNMNTVSMAKDVKDAYGMSDEQATRLARIQKLYDSIPDFYEKGGRGISGFAQNAAAAIIDPVNLLGGIFGKAAGGTAMRGAARVALKEAAAKGADKVLTSEMRGQIVRRGVMAGAKAGAKVGAVESAITGTVQDALLQGRDTELGLQDEYSIARGAGAAISNTLMGGALGGVFGAGGALYGGKISRALSKVKTKTFGDFTNKYTQPESIVAPEGVANTVDAESVGTPATPTDKSDAKVEKYVAAQREQYQRHLDATIDRVRSESGEKSLAEWRSGTIEDANKTEAMKQADSLQSGRTALEELYNWPTRKAAHERQLEQLSHLENLKPDQVTRLNELNDIISRGNDAYESIVRAAGDGREVDFDKAIDGYAKASKPLVTEVNTNPQPFQVPAVVTKDEANTLIQSIPDVSYADEKSLSEELANISSAKQQGVAIPSGYEDSLKARFKELTGEDFAYKVPDVIDVAPAAQEASALPEVSSAAEAQDAVAAIGKQYNALTNQIARINKAIKSGKAKPEHHARLKEVTAQRDALNAQRKQLEDRAAAFAEQEATAEPQPIIRTVEAEASESPLDIDGASSFLASYGFPAANIKKEMASYLKRKAPESRDGRAQIVRQYVGEKIAFARSLSHLEQSMDKVGTNVAYIPDVMRKILSADSSIPADMKDATIARYNEWLDFNSPVLLTKYMSENPELELKDVLSLISQNHGDDMERVIMSQLGGDDAEDIIQHMAFKKGMPQGWDKLTSAQQNTITQKIEYIRTRLTGPGATAISPKKLEGLLELQKRQLTIKQLEDDFGAAVRTSGQSLGDNYPVIVDPATKGTVSGKVWDYAGDGTATVGKDKYGLQAMLKKATGGRASSVDEFGDLVIENPYFGTLLVRSIERNPDGTINYAKTAEGKRYARKFSAAESARRANEEAAIKRATDRKAKVTDDVAHLKAGDQATAKELAAAKVEAARANPNRKDLNARTTGAPKDEAAEALSKELRESVKKAVLADAARNAMDTAPSAPERAMRENIAQVEAELKEPVTLKESEAAWSAVEAEKRTESVEAVRQRRVNDAVENFRIHNDAATLAADIKRINEELAPAATKPKAHADKPAGAKHEPRMYVYKGWEVDVRNQFTFKKTSDATTSISFMGEKVGDLKTSADGTATLLFTDSAGLESSVRASSVDKMAEHLPRIFGAKVEAAGADGKLTRSFDEANDSVYPIDWKASNTWGKQTRTVPVETAVDEPAKLIGQVTNFKNNPDISAINVDIPEGHVLAVHILEGDFQGVTRVESTKSKSPQTVGQILGNQKTKAYTVGYVPEGTSSASRDASRLFQPLDAQDSVYRAGAPDASTAKGKTPHIEPNELGQIKLDGLSKVAIDQNDLAIQFRDKGLTTLAKVHDLITSLENVRWSDIRTAAQYATFTQDISDLYAVRKKYAPKGIELPTASRAQSMSQLNKALFGHDGTTIATCVDILRRLSANDRNLPIIANRDMGADAGGYALPSAGSENANRIFLNPSAFDPDGKGAQVPQPVALLHEVGHWAYMNILADEDRMQFWGSLQKYFDSGSVDLNQIRQRLPGVGGDAEAMSPAEMFANQLVQWAITEGKMNNIPLWSKMARVIVQIAQAFGVNVKGDRTFADANLVDIDPDFVELFAKILPENDKMYDRYVGLYKTLEDIRQLKNDAHAKTASLAAKQLVDFDDMRRKLDSAIDTQNPMDMELALDEVARDIYSKFGGKYPKVRLLKNGGAATAKARRELLSAHAKWKELQSQLYSETSTPKELSTADLSESESGDLGSSFDAITDVAFSTMDKDLNSSLSIMANHFINAIAAGQDEARAIIGRTGQLEGKTIRVSKDGSYEGIASNNFGVIQRRRAAKRAFAKTIAAAKEIDAITADIDRGVVHANDREHLPQPTISEAAGRPVSGMSTDEIASEYKSLAGQRTVRKKELEAEIKGRISSMPEVEFKVPDAKYQDMPIKALEKDLLSSIKRGKLDEMKAIANAIGWKKRANLESGILTASSPKVRKAIKIVQEATRAAATDNGVPANMPAQVRDTIKNITHRTRADESVARMTATRLVALMGKGLSAANDGGFVTKNDISRLLGKGDIGDSSPISETDELFSSFRNEMREVAKQVRTPAGQIEAAQKLSRMALNALVAPEELSRLETNADELSAAFIAVSRGKGSIDGIFDMMPESSRTKIADIYKENVQALGLIMRGMLSPEARKDMQPLTFYGDMLREPAESRPFRSATSASGFRGAHPALADGLRKEIISSTPLLRRSSIESFSGKPLEQSIGFFDGDGSVPFEMLESKGKLVAPTSDGDFGTGVYLKTSAAEPNDFPNENLKLASQTITEIRDRIARAQANIEAMRTAGEDVADRVASVLQPLLRRLNTATATEANLWRELRVTNKIDGQPKVIPFISRAKNSFDFSNSTEYTFGTKSATSLDWLLTSLESANLIEPKVADELRNSPVALTGKEAYAKLRKAVASASDSSDTEAANTLNSGLKEMGFDSIHFGDGTMVFDADAVRHIDDAAFLVDDQVSNFLNSESVSVAGQYLEALMAGPVDNKNGSPLMAELQNMSFPPALADPIKRLYQKKTISPQDIDNVGFWTRALGESSARIRKSGAHWLADKIKPQGGSGFYEKLDATTSKALLVSRDAQGRPISVITKLRQLPGNPSIAKRWAERNKFWGKVPQPASYDAIVMALRMGDAAVAKLPKAEREAAIDLQKFFREQLVAARADGIPLGFKANFIPQVYNADVIKGDHAGFDELLTGFFLREMKQGKVPTPEGRDPVLVAKDKAVKLRRTLTNDGSDGVLLPDSGIRQSMESPFFERVMNYSPEEIPGISKYLVNDLEGIITKYADQISRRRVLTKEFGLGNHAASTYLNVLQNGKDAIVDALRNTKTMSIERRAADATMDTRVSETSEVVRAISGTVQEVEGMVDTAIEMLGTTKDQWMANKEKVRNYLLNLQDPEIVATQPEYAKRIDAIVNALAEFGGRVDAAPRHELAAMVDTINAAAKKGRDVSPQMMRASRTIRGFQQVTLLPWTTLTSIPDIGMPAIRSGNLKYAVAGWKKYLNDPHYREMGRNIAIGSSGIMHERMAHMYNDTSSRLSNAFFNLNFLTPWTDTMRPIASLIGLESFKAEAKRAQDFAARGMTESVGYKKSLRYLTRYGLEQYALPGAKAISDDSSIIATDDTIREAMMRFANEAILAPNPNDIPLWAQSPVGQIVFQLKSFQLLMGRLSKYTVNEAFNGNPAPFMMLLASSGLLGSLSLASKDIAMQRGQDGETFRQRYGSEQAMVGTFIRWYNSVAEDLGLDVEQHGTADAVAGWFSEAFMTAGGFGLFADLLHSTVEQADNQDYGKIRIAGTIFGPSASTALEGIGVAQAGLSQVFSEEPDGRTSRSAIRSVVGRVPFVGQVKPIKEAVVDSIAGESSASSGGGESSRVNII